MEGDLFLSIDLSHLDLGKTESLDIEKINREAVAIQATAQAKIAAIIKIKTKRKSSFPNSKIKRS